MTSVPRTATCTVGPSAVERERCGKPAVTGFIGNDGKHYYECEEHAGSSTYGVCRWCGESVELAEDGAWQGREDGACGCTASLEQGGSGEHEAWFGPLGFDPFAEDREEE
jgi:hypothetical protein